MNNGRSSDSHEGIRLGKQTVAKDAPDSGAYFHPYTDDFLFGIINLTRPSPESGERRQYTADTIVVFLGGIV